MAEKWNTPFDTFDAHYDAYLVPARYAEGMTPAVRICFIDKDGGYEDLWDYLSCNVVDAFLEDEDRDIIINHNISQEVLDAVIDSGFIESDPYTHVRSGYVTMGVHRMTDEGLKWFNENVEE